MDRPSLKRISWRGVGLYLIFAVAIFYLIGPVLWTLISSVSYDNELLEVPPHFIPQNPTLDHYRALLSPAVAREMNLTQVARRIPNAMKNSFIVSTSVTLLSLAFGAFAAYTFSRVKSRLHGGLLVGILMVRMIPPFVLLVPLYVLMRTFGLLNTSWSLIVSYIAFLMPFTVWILKAYFDAVPTDIEEAALVDGCGRLGVIFRITMPVARPGLISAGLLAFILSWEMLLIPLVLVSKPSVAPISVTLAAFNIGDEGLRLPHGIPAAAAILSSSIPLLIVFIFQRYIVSGLTSGSAK